MRCFTLSAAFSGLFLTGATQAATLGLYEFHTGTYDATLSHQSTDTDPDSTASLMVVGGGFGAQAANRWGTSATTFTNSVPRHLFVRGHGAFGGTPANVDIVDGTDEATAVAADDYFEFTISPNSGYEIDFTGFTLKYVVTADVAAPDRQGTAFVRSSLDGFASTLGSVTDSNVQTSPNTAFGNPDLSINLSVLGSYQNVAGPVSFRVYLYETGTGGTNVIHRLEDVTIAGDVSLIPEPGAIAALGLMGLLPLRRRRAR